MFETTAGDATLRLQAEDVGLWRAADTWQELVDGPIRVAETAYQWTRSRDRD